MFLPATREPDPGDMYTFFYDSLPDGRTGSRTRTHEPRPGDPLVAKRYSCHFCDFSKVDCAFLKKNTGGVGDCPPVGQVTLIILRNSSR